MKISHKNNNFAFMLAGIILFTTLGPLVELAFGRADGIVLMMSYTLMLIVGIWSLQQTRIVFNIGLVIGSMCVGLTIIDLLLDELNLSLYVMAGLLVFQCMSMWIACRLVFSRGEMTINRLMGGVCIFLLLGLTWNILYVFIIYLDPGSFKGIPAEVISEQNVYWEMTYFSFVTLTTLGYGDITPLGRMAKVFTYAEAVVGQLYIAILIGALVGSYMRGQENQNA